MAKKEQKGLFPEQPDSGVQGLFEQSRRASTLADPPSAAQPASAHEPPALPGSNQPPAQKKPARKKRRHRFGLWRFVPHLAIALIALIGIARRNSDTSVDIPKVTSLQAVTKAPRSSSETPAYKTMVIGPSHGPVANGVYRATGSALHGAGRKTSLEFALVGSGSKQRVRYVAGFHVRDVSCDREPKSDATAGLILYDDELTSRRLAGGGAFSASTSDHDESIQLTGHRAGTIYGTFRFHGYTHCPAGGHFTFTATRDPKDRPVLASGIYGAFG